MPGLINLLVGIQCSDGFSVLTTASGRHCNGEVLSDFFSIAIAYLNPRLDGSCVAVWDAAISGCWQMAVECQRH